MFFSEQDITAELLGVFKLKRGSFRHNSVQERYYDTLSIRIQGEATFKSGAQTMTVRRGDLLYIPRRSRYTQQSEGETVIAFHFINYTQTPTELPERLTFENAQEAEQLFCDAYNAWNQKKPGYKYECTALLYRLLYLAKQQQHGDALDTVGPNERIAGALDYLHKHYKEDKVSVANLAAMATMSEAYFRQVFRKLYGVSPCRYMTNLRLEYAAQLLQSQLYTVGEVGEKAGFTDVKYFERVFKARYGCTPNQYKKKVPDSNWV